MDGLDIAAFRATPLTRQPFSYLVVPEFIKPAARAVINADYPAIDSPGSFPVADVRYGPGFQYLLDELSGPVFRAACAEKFGLDLRGRSTLITVRGRCGTRDGNIHTDAVNKIITVLIYMNPTWEQAGGRLRLLRSGNDIEDVIVEVPPVEGTLVAFRRSDNSWHGHKPFIGPRRVVQLNWVANASYRRREFLRHRMSAWMKKTLSLFRRSPETGDRMKLSTLQRRQFQRILLLKPSAVGDVIHTLPVLAKLRARYPEARIDWLLTPAIAELIGHHSALSNVVLFDRGALVRDWRGWLAGMGRLIAQLWQTRYDLVLDLHGQFRSALLTLATRAPVRLGFDRPCREPRSPLDRRLIANAYRHGWTGTREGAWLAYTHRIPLPRSDVHAVDRYLWLTPILGLDDGPPEFHVPIPPQSTAAVDALLARHGLRNQPFLVLVPGTIWPTKHWTIEGFAAVARHLRGSGWAVVLAGSPAERQRCQAVASLAPGILDLCGQTTLSELAALLRRAELCVTNDSGSMHLAVALGRPVVSVFGPTDELWIGPYRRPESVVRASLDCAPCYFRQLHACPHNHACMTSVTPGRVIERIEALLAADRRATA